MIMDNVLIETAMKIILHAGDGRNYLDKALNAAKKFDFESADELKKEAEDCIRKAHQAQTNIIQDEANGNKYEYCLLFNHAQDTLMTIASELRLTNNLIDVLRIISKK